MEDANDETTQTTHHSSSRALFCVVNRLERNRANQANLHLAISKIDASPLGQETPVGRKGAAIGDRVC